MSGLRCEIIERDNALVMRLVGQISINEAHDFENQIGCVIERKPPVLVLDMSRLQFITSGGIGSLVKFERRAADMQCELRIAACQKSIADIIRNAGLDSFFSMYATVEDALGQ